MTALSRLILLPSIDIGKPGPSAWGPPGSKVGDGSASRARNVDFGFIQTRFAYGFRSNEWINEPVMAALDQAAGRSSAIRRKMSAKRPLGMATSAIWKAM